MNASASGCPSAVASTMVCGGKALPATGSPPRMPNGTSTTTEPEWSAAIGPSRAGMAAGITPIG
jgi:hypothetical protein